MSHFEYPVTRQVDVVDDYHGTPIADPYRWLENPFPGGLMSGQIFMRSCTAR